ncbi:MAG: DUF58 domain-containing protein [Vibrio sp.]|uniref:DUF58 domain-containing protein n=1 Tax=Vibrio sp. TaxID=678 RepID=UPI003A8372AE
MDDKHNRLDPRIYVDIRQLNRTRSHVSNINLLGARYSRAQMSGRYHSHARGRGLNFEELRHYQKGDDIRQMDWKVTQRTGKPHVRSYTEEKDRQIILCVDQRSAMFFGSVSHMKSVVAAETAALMGWMALAQNDRVGFLICDHQKFHWRSAKRGGKSYLLGLNELVQANHKLNVQTQSVAHVGMSHWLKALQAKKLKSATFIIISDFIDADEQTLRQLQYLHQHNDVISIFVSDPLESALPTQHLNAPWVIGDGEYQFALQQGKQSEKAYETLQQRHEEKREQLKMLMAAQKLPCIEIGTQGDHFVQLAKYLEVMK